MWPSGPENSVNESAVREDLTQIFLCNATLVKVLFFGISRIGVFQQNLTGTVIPQQGNTAVRMLDSPGSVK